jgi:predicted outer membrane protein
MFGRWNGLVVVVAQVALVTLPVAAQDRPTATGPDQELVTRLHQLGQDEIALAKLGEDRGVSARVRTFAGAVRSEQAGNEDALIAYAERKNMNRTTVGRPGGALEHRELAIAPVANSPRNQFDYTFVTQMVADHQASIDAATAAARLARDPELRALIDGVLKIQTNHLVSAQALLQEIPAPAARVVQLPAFPAGVSRTQTGADEPPPAALQPGALNR